MCCFDTHTHTHCEMTTTMKLKYPSPHVVTVLCVCVCLGGRRTLKIYSLSKFQVYNTVSLILLTMLYIRSLEFFHFLPFSPFPSPGTEPGSHALQVVSYIAGGFFTDWNMRILSLYLLDFKSWDTMAPHSSTLAWKIPWMEESGRLRSMGSLRVGHNWATSLSLFTFTHWRRKWQPTPVFLPEESQEWGSLVGCRLWDHTESDDKYKKLRNNHFSMA